MKMQPGDQHCCKMDNKGIDMNHTLHKYSEYTEELNLQGLAQIFLSNKTHKK